MAVTDRVEGHARHLGVRRRARHAGPARRQEGKQARHARERHERSDLRRTAACRPTPLVGEEGEGFINTLQVLDAGRIGIAALVGRARAGRLRGRAATTRSERRQFGQPIASFQAIQWKLADMATRIEAARLLTYRAAWLQGSAGAPRTTRESSMAKLYASEIAVRAAEECVQIHGGYGFVKDYPAEKYFRDVKLCTIGEGTSEIQRLVIARQLLGR